VFIEEYHSDSDSIESEIILPAAKPRKRKTWQTAAVFQNRDEAIEWLKINQNWSLEGSYDTEAGRKEMYRCNHVKKRGPQCEKSMHLQYNSHNQGVICFETTSNHTHDEILKTQKKTGINEATKESILKQLELGVKKPKTICANLANEILINPEIEIPNDRQLLNFLQTLKGPNHKIMNFGELITHLELHAQIPDDPDQPFLMYQLKIDDEDKQKTFPENSFDLPINAESFRFFVTTRRLLSIAKDAKFIHADSTYKLIWNDFPVLICGTSDKNKVFHPFGLSVCSSEKEHDYQFMFECLQVGLEATNQPKLPNNGSIALIADAADAITNGFKGVFAISADFLRVMCWFHVKKAVDNKLAMLAEKPLQDALLKDIDVLHLATSKEQFNVATKLFIEKYSSNQNVNMKQFLKYFQNEWLVKHPGWYEGYLEGCPSTNNGLESINGTLKKESTFRTRTSLAEFITTANCIAKSWSSKRDPASPNHPKIFVKETTVTTKDLTAAYDWSKEAVVIQKLSQGSKHFYFKSKTALNEVNSASVKKYSDSMKSFQIRSFDEYHNIFFSIWHIEFNADLDNTNWREGKCSCPAYQKNYICKHLIGLASRLKCLTIPDVAKNVEIGAKRKRGRPALARKALEYQTVQKTAESATTTPLKRPQEDNVVPPPKRSRGRPPKSLAPSVESTQSSKPLRSRVIQHMS
jgi:hypothetical protein